MKHKKEIDSFINSYLQPYYEYTPTSDEEIINNWLKLKSDYESPNIDKDFICLYIRNKFPLKYDTPNNDNKFYQMFLTTKYWKILSAYVKYINGNVCFFYYNHKIKLQIHHKTYEIYGREILNLEHLLCLCKACHYTLHNNWENGTLLINENDLLQHQLENLKISENYNDVDFIRKQTNGESNLMNMYLIFKTNLMNFQIINDLLLTENN